MDKKSTINEAITYIIQHMDQDISVGDVAEHFHFSKYYFCRIFREITGESIYAFIKRLKMDQSAIDLKLEKNKMITDIGLDYGYSASNYSSAFKAHHHISPAAFRKSIHIAGVSNPFFPQEEEKFGAFHDYDQQISIRQIQSLSVRYERFIGNYIELKERWLQFMDDHKAEMDEHTLIIERFYHDPMITTLNQCICDLCITVDEDKQDEDTATIAGGKFVVYHYIGKIQNIFGTLQGIFTVWFPDSGYEMREYYGFNIYRDINWSTESVRMDLYIPIR